MAFLSKLLNCAVAATAALMCGCVSMNYIGNQYAPTSQVDFFFDERDFPAAEYVVMGTLTASLSEEDAAFRSNDALNQAIREKALAVGADSVLIMNA